MDFPRRLAANAGAPWISKLVGTLGVLLILQIVVQEVIAMRSHHRLSAIIAATAFGHYNMATASIDLGWYPPDATAINNLTNVLDTTGVYGFVYNNSYPTDVPYGTYDWCNMPHVRKEEYIKPSDEYKLKYVELIHRHHKRTVYASNSFPVESYGWNCDDEGLFFYGQPFTGNKSSHTYWHGYISPTNPFKPSGFIGSCQFPQITAEGLDDSWQHGVDLYDVYGNLLHFLPDDISEAVSFRVTQNTITSQVAGMVISGMFKTQDNIQLLVEPNGYDSLEPTYSCNSASTIYNNEKSSPKWNAHLTAATSLYATLDDISGVSPTDSGFHASFDHYYDNLSARQCHSKPLPCKLVNGVNSTTCVSQIIADEVYRFGNWEYSYIYRDSSTSLNAAVGSFGVWIAELATHIRDLISGKSDIIYRHNVAHDGSVSRLLSFLQIDVMVWPGMGSEVVFEVYQKTSTSTPTTMVTATPSTIAPSCNHDDCLRQFIQESSLVSAFCPTYTASVSSSANSALPTFVSNCNNSPSKVFSACSCIVTPTATSTPSSNSTISPSGYYMRILWGGKVLRSSSPTLGLMDMVPLETVLAYFDGLVGVGASLIVAKCSGNIPY